MKKGLATNANPGKFVDSIINKKPRYRKKKVDSDNKLVCVISIRGISEKFKRIGEIFNIKTVFKTKYTLGNFLRKTKHNIDTLDKSQCIYGIPCECGRECFGEIGRLLNIRIRDHKYNLREGHIDKSKLASHAFDEGHRIDWINTTILQSEPNTIYRKYKEAAGGKLSRKLRPTPGCGANEEDEDKEAARMLCTDNSISQPSLDISPLRFPLIDIESHK